MDMTTLRCFHCDEPVTTGFQFVTNIEGKPQPMCCPGCQAVSQAIVDAGLTSYYKYRTEPGVKQNELVPQELMDFHAYDLPEVQSEFVYSKDDLDETSLSIDGITCAACAWLIEHKVGQLEGVDSVHVNSTTQRALIRWSKSTLPLSKILNQISAIGYQAAPYQVDEQEKISKKNSRIFLLRLGLAGFATMQVMMFAFALYAGYFSDLEQEYRDYFRWVSMMFAAPVVLYSAVPFYFSAIRAVISGRLNMDVSVSIAIIAAFTASCYATVQGQGEVYFESVSMFTFFLLLGRYLEQNARQRASVSSSNLHKLIPLTANLLQDGQQQEIPAKKLKLQDVIIIKPGDVIPADGVVVNGLSSVNEAMLTGEQMPIHKTLASQVYAGTINVEQPLQVQVNALGQDQLVAEIIRLQELAASNKPQIALIADKLARYFTASILTIAALTYLYWYWAAPEDAFWITLSVLVATCPCALALATPTAVTCATALFTKMGVITRKADVFEKLPKVDHVVFDKTGTLTCGALTIKQIQILNPSYTQGQVQSIAAAMERDSRHPIAKAFNQYNHASLTVSESNHEVGFGIEAQVNNIWYRIGKQNFCHANDHKASGQLVWLSQASPLDNSHPMEGRQYQAIASFELQDSVRADAKTTVKSLIESGCEVTISSGDAESTVATLAHSLGITSYYGDMSPADKLHLVHGFQKNQTVAMFGDGINDAPVLAGADLSVAMGSGSAIAKNSADLILLGDQLSRYTQSVRIAKLTSQIIKQNLFWALGYNLFILPLAVTGHVVPYIAALGMSTSSLVVVSNSLRLLRNRA